MLKVFTLFATIFIAYFTQTPDLLSRQLPVVIKLNDFPEATEFELMLRENLAPKGINVITVGQMQQLFSNESQRAALRYGSQITRNTDMNAYVEKVMTSIATVAKRLTVTVVTDKNGLPDSCYFEVTKIPTQTEKKAQCPESISLTVS